MESDSSKNIRGATESGPRPGEFPLGSELSRAAARAMLETRAAMPGESIPTAMKMLSPEDREILQPYFEAREGGEERARE
jgi:hypothetical protein